MKNLLQRGREEQRARMSCSIVEAQYQPVELISHREYRRRLFAKGLEEQGAKASAKVPLGKNKGLLCSRQREDALCEAFDGASVREPHLSDVIFTDEIWDILGGENKDPLMVTDFLDFLAAESVGDSWQVKLEIPMKGEDTEDKQIRPSFEAPWVEEVDEFLWQSLFGKKDAQSSRQPRSESPRKMQVEIEEGAKGMEEEEEREQPRLEYECDWLFDGKEEDERSSWRLDAWPQRSELLRRIQVESEGSTMGMEEEEEEDPEMMGPQDRAWMTPRQYRREWDYIWSDDHGSFEDTSEFSSNHLRLTFDSLLHYSLLSYLTSKYNS